MKTWKITVQGAQSFSLTKNYQANRIEDAIIEAVKVALTLSREMLVNVNAVLEK